MNSVLVEWPDPVTSTVNAPSCNEFEYSWLTGTSERPVRSGDRLVRGRKVDDLLVRRVKLGEPDREG